MSSRIARPQSSDGAGWLVYDHLAGTVLADPAAPDLLNTDQNGLVAFYDLRTQVNSDGFEGYFSYDYGDDAPAALRMAGMLGAPGWHALIADAVALFGEAYPDDQDDRSERVDELADASRFSAFDDRFYRLEADHQLDAIVDRYVWERPASFFLA
jgi:Domain of unknown function (DUF4375)